ncbi:putative RING-H2 finger protein atl21a [Phtheirospermum japonicum]|uniref:RING-type E3 ubiquitin transferase n=1 Tax=Phtheirospermum japonicum TaxID=374723 RepID=A0A830C5A8_9LAMI|nr:putative RING-H2 finger protein atl21a [Phtheirospermum japonicum]
MDSTNKPIITIIIFFFFIFLILSLFTQTISASEICSNTFCRRPEPVIRFPFRLQRHQPAACGYPGFDLFCDAFNQTLVELPNSGEFTVEAIDYAAQNIWLNDPQNCLPRRLLSLNLSGSPFSGYFFQEFTLFNCTFDYRKYRFDRVACLSGHNYTVIASSSERAIRFLAARCGLVATVAVPVQWAFFQPVMTSDLGGDMRLAWGSPRCRRCEGRGGRCGFRGFNSTVIECRNVPHRLPKAARYAIVIGAGLPAFLCLIGMLCFICSRITNRRGRRHHRRPIMEFSVVVAPQPAATATISGLDGPTIESYPKTTLGESRRLPKPDDNICAICLSEYMPKETLRSIPECRHCFHADCIDEWLKLNSSCPVCRVSPQNSTPSWVS